MSRYFERFLNGLPMVEIDEIKARERGAYAQEVAGPPLRLLCFVDNELDKIVYPGWSDPAEPLADMRIRAEGARGEVYSPVECDQDGNRRWRAWHASPAGKMTKILEPEFDREWRLVRELHKGPDGVILSCQEYHYDDEGELIEVVTRAADGSVLNREEA